jgi:CHAT domain-containing protein
MSFFIKTAIYNPCCSIFLGVSIVLISCSPSAFGQKQQEKVVVAEDSRKKAESLFQKALSLSISHEYKPARAFLVEAMQYWNSIQESGKAASAALQMGDRCWQDLIPQEALFCYERALEAASLRASVKATTLNSIAGIYTKMYHRDLALYYYNRALKEARLGKEILEQSRALLGLAHIYYQLGEQKQTIACLAQVQQLNRTAHNQEVESAYLYLIGQVNQENGLFEQAKEALQKALLLYQKSENKSEQALTLASLSNLHRLFNKKTEALEYAEQAVKLTQQQVEQAAGNADKTRFRELSWRTWLSLARAQRASGKNDAAKSSYLRTIAHLEGVWLVLYISTESTSIAFREEIQAPYREYIDLLIEQGQIATAYEWAERAKGRVVLGLTAARRKGVELPQESVQQGIFQKLSQIISGLRTHLYAVNRTPAQRRILQEQLTEAQYTLQEARLKFEMDHARERWNWSQPTTVQQLQKSITLQQNAILEYSLGESRSFVWLISATEVSVAILSGRRKIETLVEQYLQTLSSPPHPLYPEKDLLSLQAQASTLFFTLFGALSEKIAAHQKLIIVPDGQLHSLPFETLIRNKQFLIEQHEISYVPSANMLQLLTAPKNEIAVGKKMELLAIGDPVFTPPAKAIRRKKLKSNANQVERRLNNFQNFYLAPLPNTRDEIQYIASLFPQEDEQIYFGKDGTEEVIKQKSLRQYRRLHLATHSLVDEKAAYQSAIVLTLDADPLEDGFLEEHEISELDLDCDLVVLSACQTARGQLFRGEGIVGFSRSFLYAGAQSVVVSLWNVTDISTARLMKQFYQQLSRKIRNTTALRQAKLQMLQSSFRTRHPYYWAPFILIGEP